MSDRQVGFTLLLAVVALLGALTLFVASNTGDQVTAGWGFAVAMAGAGLSVAAYHLYE